MPDMVLSLTDVCAWAGIGAIVLICGKRQQLFAKVKTGMALTIATFLLFIGLAEH